MKELLPRIWRFSLPGLAAAGFAAFLAASPAPSAETIAPDTARAGVVSHVKVLSNHVEDVSSIEAWKRSFIKDGMTDEQKAMAVWEAVVRFAGTQRNTTCLFDFRIDADYREPHGEFRPVRITYLWDEGGVEKRDVHVAARPAETYRIQCTGKPTMKSLIVELAQ